MVTPVSMKMLLESGVHFGHQTRRWDPRMRPFIFAERNGIHIIDLQQTVQRLQEACDFVRGVAAQGERILFVGTKKQAQEAVEAEAKGCGMPYVTNRWLGGTLTNFQTIQRRIDYLVRLEDGMARGELLRLPKKEVLKLEKEITRLNRYFGGIKEITTLPGALFIIDPTKEYIATTEARRMQIPIVAMADTNCNPDLIDYPIPSNDDAIRAIKLMTNRIAEAVLEGQALREQAEAAGAQVGEASAEELVEFQRSGFTVSPDEPGPDELLPAEAEGGPAGEGGA